MAGAFRILERGGCVAQRGGAEEVVRQLAVRAVEAPGAELLERAPDPPVQLTPLRGRQILVEGLADERVGEAAPSECREVLVDEARADRRTELVEHAVARQLAHDLQEADVEPPANPRPAAEPRAV